MINNLNKKLFLVPVLIIAIAPLSSCGDKETVALPEKSPTIMNSQTQTHTPTIPPKTHEQILSQAADIGLNHVIVALSDKDPNTTAKSVETEFNKKSKDWDIKVNDTGKGNVEVVATWAGTGPEESVSRTGTTH